MTCDHASPILSVIIPAHNAEEYVTTAIGSVLYQSNHEVEIIVVNDGSVDKTAEISKQFGEQIRYIEQANQGVSVARNSGINIAKGPWVAWLDADDFWLPNYWRHLKPILISENQFNVLCFGWSYSTETGDIVGKSYVPKAGQVELEDIVYSNKILSHSAVVRREEVIKIGGFDPELTYAEDWDVWIRLALSGNRFRKLSVPLVVYRLRSNSLSKNLEIARKQGQVVINRAFSGAQLPESIRIKHDSARGLFLVQMVVCELGADNRAQALEDLEEAFNLAPQLSWDEQTYFSIASCKQPVYEWGTGRGIELTYQYEFLSGIIDSLFGKLDLSSHDQQRVLATMNLVFLKLAYLQNSRMHMFQYWIKMIAANPNLLTMIRSYVWLIRMFIGKPRRLDY